jgi:hypothetical protein
MSASNCLEGACHCKNIQLHFYTEQQVANLSPRQCQCSFCRKHNASWISDPHARVEVTVAMPEKVSHYRLGTKTAEFLICGVCGVVPLVTCRMDDTLHGVLNRYCFETSEVFGETVKTDFSSEDVTNRLERRKRTWISQVKITKRA